MWVVLNESFAGLIAQNFLALFFVESMCWVFLRMFSLFLGNRLDQNWQELENALISESEYTDSKLAI